MASTWWYEQTKLSNRFMERRFGFVFFYSRKLSLVLFSPQAHDGDYNRGSHAIRRHFVSHYEVTLRISAKKIANYRLFKLPVIRANFVLSARTTSVSFRVNLVSRVPRALGGEKPWKRGCFRV